jgi:hypothetical protein
VQQSKELLFLQVYRLDLARILCELVAADEREMV